MPTISSHNFSIDCPPKFFPGQTIDAATADYLNRSVEAKVKSEIKKTLSDFEFPDPVTGNTIEIDFSKLPLSAQSAITQKIFLYIEAFSFAKSSRIRQSTPIDPVEKKALQSAMGMARQQLKLETGENPLTEATRERAAIILSGPMGESIRAAAQRQISEAAQLADILDDL